MGASKLVYAFFGDRLGRLVVGSYNWFLGKQVEEGGDIAVAVAEQSLREMQEGTQKLTEAIAAQFAAYQGASQLVQAKQKEYETFMKQADAAMKANNTEAARYAATNALELKNEILPDLYEALRTAEEAVHRSKEKLGDQQRKYEKYKADLKNMKDKAEMNKALEAVTKATNMYNLDSAANAFEQSKKAVNKKTTKVEVIAALNENPAEAAAKQAKQLTASSEVDDLLKQLADPNHNQKLLGS